MDEVFIRTLKNRFRLKKLQLINSLHNLDSVKNLDEPIQPKMISFFRQF